jgi:hypothetical protein
MLAIISLIALMASLAILVALTKQRQCERTPVSYKRS